MTCYYRSKAFFIPYLRPSLKITSSNHGWTRINTDKDEEGSGMNPCGSVNRWLNKRNYRELETGKLGEGSISIWISISIYWGAVWVR